ncbi:MAG: hypothetical protein HKN16_11900 [Saprospiraceae bacterium]|nr:hypothetical protein [Saprospiraceae bacterium]
MKAVQVRYKVKPEYAEQNKANIQAVMQSLKENPVPGLYYAAYNLEDGQTFVHVNLAKDEETLKKINDLAAFLNFRKGLKESGPIEPPQATNMEPVAAGWEL